MGLQHMMHHGSCNDVDKGDRGPGVFTTQLLMRKTPAKNKTMAVWIAEGSHSLRVHWGMEVGTA
jgi:hypothetical protein